MQKTTFEKNVVNPNSLENFALYPEQPATIQNNLRKNLIQEQRLESLQRIYTSIESFQEQERIYILQSKSNPKPYIYRLDNRVENKKTALLDYLLAGGDPENYKLSLQVARQELYKTRTEQNKITTLDGNSEATLENIQDDGGMQATLDAITAEQIEKIPGLIDICRKVEKIYTRKATRKLSQKELQAIKQYKKTIQHCIA